MFAYVIITGENSPLKVNVACHESSFLKSFSHDKQQNFYSTLFLTYISSLGMTPKKHLEFPDYVAGHATLRKQEYYEKQGDLACLLRLLLWDLLGYVLFFSLYRHDLDVFHSLLSHISITKERRRRSSKDARSFKLHKSTSAMKHSKLSFAPQKRAQCWFSWLPSLKEK